MRLAELLGARLPPLQPEPRAETVLDALTWGPFADDLAAPPPHPESTTWVRVTAAPPGGANVVGPVDRLLDTLSGGTTPLEIVIRRTGGSPELLLGADAATGFRLRQVLTPACDVVPAATPTLVQGLAAGVVFRLRPETGTPGGLAEAALLERLASVPGPWTVLVRASPVPARDLLAADRELDLLADAAAARTGRTVQIDPTASVAQAAPGWDRVLRWVDAHHGHLSEAAAHGGWLAATWVTAPGHDAFAEVLSALYGAVRGDAGRRLVAVDLDPDVDAPEPASLLTSRDLAQLVGTPATSVPGLRVRRAPPGHRRPATSGDALDLGTYWGTDLPAAISLSDLEGHAFVTGTTGSGKTTTLHRLLQEAWNRRRVPFLVIDPVKDDYSSTAGSFTDGLQVVTGRELCLDVMAPWPGEDPATHIALLAQAFRGSFTMPSPTPYVVTQLFDGIAMQPGGPAGTDLFDVRDRLAGVVDRLGYAPEAHANILASLTTRLNVLLAPLRAHRFAWSDSTMVEQLFRTPTVVTLADLADDEERSFVVLLLALATWAHARARRRPKQVHHLLVLEEAHRILPEIGSGPAGEEAGSAGSVSSQLISAMLAEARGFGQQVIVVDQSPAKVDSSVLRNTNTKIVHRIVHPEDQEQVAAALGLEPQDRIVLGALDRGQALISTRREPSPQAVAVARMSPPSDGVSTAALRRVRVGGTSWPCCAGKAPEGHFRARAGAARTQAAIALFVIACRIGQGDGHAVRREVYGPLRAAAATLTTTEDCLSWAGLRRMLTLEREGGRFTSSAAVDQALGAGFEMWRDRAPITAQNAHDLGASGTGRRMLCPACGTTCGISVPAGAILAEAPRTGLVALAGPGWRSDIPDVAAWLADQLAVLTKLLGRESATTVLVCQVHQSVRRHRLPEDVAGLLLKRAGMR
ncbi:MAG: ATP-binding protein [Austwickia sp.]|nr:ATP-binding protein [Actinomycetota bacterium]MCB1251732.1 ATP-binding protein [Austwickia sp.]MCO5308527.1 ATP-binding protein [Austwickia sp.]